MKHRGMTLKELYFGSQGRIPRSTLWLLGYLPYLAILSITLLIDKRTELYIAETHYGFVSVATWLLLLYPMVCLSIKRLHDRGHNGTRMFLFLVPIVNIWMSLELFYLPSAKGENEYGPQP